MKQKIKYRICEISVAVSMIGIFLTVGALENFSISVGEFLAIGGAFAAIGFAAVVFGCWEDSK